MTTESDSIQALQQELEQESTREREAFIRGAEAMREQLTALTAAALWRKEHAKEVMPPDRTKSAIISRRPDTSPSHKCDDGWGDAFQAGAEAMREAIVQFIEANIDAVACELNGCGEPRLIRSLPLPTPKREQT